MKKYKCKCCGYYTLYDEPVDPDVHPGTYEICHVCGWEDDSLQFLNPDKNYGPNGVSLNQAKLNFKLYGAIREDLIHCVRKPKQSEMKKRE